MATNPPAEHIVSAEIVEALIQFGIRTSEGAALITGYRHGIRKEIPHDLRCNIKVTEAKLVPAPKAE